MCNMLFVFCLLLVPALEAASIDPAYMIKNVRECALFLNLDIAKVFGPLAQEKPKEGVLPKATSQEQKCLEKCVMEKEGLLNVAGELQKDALEKIVEDAGSADFDKCATVAGEDPCDRAAEMRYCISQQVAMKA